MGTERCLSVSMDALMFENMYKCVKRKKPEPWKDSKMYFGVVLKEEAIVRNTTPTGI